MPRVGLRLPLLLLPILSTVLPAQGLDYVKEHYSKREVMVPMRDGAALFTCIYTPKDTAKTYPFIMQRTPYSVAPYGEGKFKTDLGPTALFGKEGFIFVYQDVRGRFLSEGTFNNMTPHLENKTKPTDVDESSDTYDTIEWLLKNVTGNNGRVGMWGISYPGFYAAAGMIGAHPALKASSPQAPVTDWFTGDDFHRNGALWLPHGFNFMATFGLPRPKPTTEWGRRFEHGTPDGYDFFLNKMGALSNADPRFLHGQVAFWNEMMEHPDFDAFWQSRNLRPHLKDIKPAVLTVGGWFDAENLFGALQVHDKVGKQSPATTNFLVMGPWVHGGWNRTPGDKLGDVKFGARTSEYFQKEVEFPFFMHYLKDAPAPKLSTATVFETGRNVWRHLDQWPPRTAKSTEVYFQPGGRLGFAVPPQGGGFDEYISDPARPVPFWPGIDTGMVREYMVADQRFVSTRPDVLVFETSVLDKDLTVAGPIQVHLRVSVSGTDADFVVKVIDVWPDDYRDPDEKLPPRAKYSPLGGTEQMVRGEVMRGKFRDSLSKPEPFEPDVPTAVDYQLNDIFHTFRKGHRLMVQVHSTWFPLMDRNPQVFLDINKAKDSDFKKATIRLHHNRAQASSLVLPVLEP
ncbi:MAG: CocE/NonD family hydrolase [Holophagaceae bacterium]|nr:CocE/NonD family hydrolase [Holophagaceae bacterium]